jgi:hypothetical protein
MASTFAWWDAKVPAAQTAAFAKKREAMYLRELEERAALLFRLRYPKDEARRRLEEEYLTYHRWFRQHGLRIPDSAWRACGSGSADMAKVCQTSGSCPHS